MAVPEEIRDSEFLENLKNSERWQFCQEQGSKAEEEFMFACKIRGIPFYLSQPMEDMRGHIDCYIELDGKILPVDIKSEKKISKELEYTPIELMNVKGENGWLFGMAEVFAFEIGNYFYLIEKQKLQEIVWKNYSGGDFADTYQESLYVPYRREGRKDIITLIDNSLIESNCLKELQKYKPVF